MRFIYLAIFAIFTAIHLYGSFKQKQAIRNTTKGLILLALLGFYLESVNALTITPESYWFVILALLFSWLGDILLIPHGVKWFTAGGIAFWISHFFFILAYNTFIDFSLVPIWAIIPIAVVYIVVVVLEFKELKKHLPKPLFYPMFLYLLTNGAMNCFAWYRLISQGFNLGTIITAIGALGFFVSDCCLFFVRFNKESKMKTHFWVMLAYSLGELLIVLGLVL